MNSKLKGTLCGIGAAVCYGMNPLGALPLYADGINTDSVLFYRYGIAAVILALYIVVVNKSSLHMSSMKLTFYVLLFAIAVVVLHSFAGDGHSRIQILTTWHMWTHALLLAVLPTVFSLLLMVVSVLEVEIVIVKIILAFPLSLPNILFIFVRCCRHFTPRPELLTVNITNRLWQLSI